MKNAKLLNSYTLRMTKKIAFAAIYVSVSLPLGKWNLPQG